MKIKYTMKCFKFALYSTQRLHFLQFTFFVIINPLKPVGADTLHFANYF